LEILLRPKKHRDEVKSNIPESSAATVASGYNGSMQHTTQEEIQKACPPQLQYLPVLFGKQT
jgi:hypothetical protein